MENTSNRTHNHDEIRDWVEERGGIPSIVSSTVDANGGGMIRVDFGSEEEGLEEISWDQFFDIFEERSLDFVYQDQADDGAVSLFYKFVERE